MASVQFKAFLSCSFSAEDKEIVDFFDLYIKSFGLDTIKYDYQETTPLSDAVKDTIRNADCLIAIATRRSPLAAGEWICPPWIEHEVIYAHALRKPVAIFAEEGVQIGGLIANDHRFQIFSKDKMKLLGQVPHFTKFLMSFHDRLVAEFKKSMNTLPSFIRRSIFSRDEMIDRERFSTTCEVEIECLEDGLARCDDGFGDIDWLRRPSEAIKEFEFFKVQGPPGINVTYQLSRSKEGPNDWSVIFSPPLKTGQHITYAFSYKAEKIRPYTLEEAVEAIDRREYWSDDPRCAINWDLDVATQDLVSEVTFPVRYPIHDPCFVVEAIESGTKNAQEIEKIRQSGGFKIERHWFSYRLILTVSNPVRGYRYLISWIPPSLSELA